MAFKLLQAPAIEPVTLAEAKLFARVYQSNEDELIDSLITAAREQCETVCRQAFITQKWRMYMDAFPGYLDQRLGGSVSTIPIATGASSYLAGIRWAIVPPYPPVQTIDALAYIAPNGNTLTMTPDVDYIVDTSSQPARATPTFGKFWPIARVVLNAVWIDSTAGYGDTADTVPASIKTAIKMLVAHWYANREAVSAEGMKEIPIGVERLLAPFRDLRMG